MAVTGRRNQALPLQRDVLICRLTEEARTRIDLVLRVNWRLLRRSDAYTIRPMRFPLALTTKIVAYDRP